MSGYTVIDVETTGFSSRHNDRVVEIAAVYVSETGRVEGEWTTLVNPGRDVGPTHIHGITAGDVLDAPRFEDIAPHVLRSVAGRTIVAHNASFDTRFLAAELLRAGVLIEVLPLLPLCTMQWAPHLRLGAVATAGRLLRRGGNHPRGRPFGARRRARATARLLAVYLMRAAAPPCRGSRCRRSASATRGRPTTESCRRCGWRTVVQRSPVARTPWLDRIVARLPRAGGAAEDSYLEVLGRPLVDRHSSAHEQGLRWSRSPPTWALARSSSMNSTCATSGLWARWLPEDGVVTPERRDLDRVAASLGLGDEAVAGARESDADTGLRSWMAWCARAGVGLRHRLVAQRPRLAGPRPSRRVWVWATRRWPVPWRVRRRHRSWRARPSGCARATAW